MAPSLDPSRPGGKTIEANNALSDTPVHDRAVDYDECVCVLVMFVAANVEMDRGPFAQDGK